jgi:hypothetical protein
MIYRTVELCKVLRQQNEGLNANGRFAAGPEFGQIERDRQDRSVLADRDAMRLKVEAMLDAMPFRVGI